MTRLKYSFLNTTKQQYFMLLTYKFYELLQEILYTVSIVKKYLREILDQEINLKKLALFLSFFMHSLYFVSLYLHDNSYLFAVKKSFRSLGQPLASSTKMPVPDRRLGLEGEYTRSVGTFSTTRVGA